MGLFSHATFLLIPSKEHGRLVARSMMESSHSLLFTRPYKQEGGKDGEFWMSVYLPLGLAYKDVPELPTTTSLEIDCLDGDGLSLKLFASDRVAFHFETGVGDVGEEEDRLLELAAELYTGENTGASDIAEGDEDPEAQGFWAQDEERQNQYVDRARRSPQYQTYLQESRGASAVPPMEPLAPLLPEGRTIDQLGRLLRLAASRLEGAPEAEEDKALLREVMDGKEHSDSAEDFVRALERFFGLKGALHSQESLMEQHSGAVDGRIVTLPET
ncbi:MAG: hypothetical protein RLY93_05860 [Sumerlaeia bacterium]